MFARKLFVREVKMGQGNFGHAGRPGEVGGSAPGGGGDGKEPWQMNKQEYIKFATSKIFEHQDKFKAYIDPIIKGKKYALGGLIAMPEFKLELFGKFFREKDFSKDQLDKISEFKKDADSLIKKYNMDSYKEHISRAISDGKEVPADVLKDFQRL
jgi:hypothetical protein